MAVIMAVTYSEDFAAAGSVAGLPYDESECAVSGVCFLGDFSSRALAIWSPR